METGLAHESTRMDFSLHLLSKILPVELKAATLFPITTVQLKKLQKKNQNMTSLRPKY